ncbi:MAG: glucokinase [Verrucomicrobiales bacterium]|nr:glucokinase [Verrucomicrobiales bacterium]
MSFWDSRMHRCIGIEIGGTKLQIVASDESGNISERLRFSVLPSSGGAGIREQIRASLPDLIKKTNARAIGVGFGGPVDWTTGHICCSHQIEGWSEFPLQSWLTEISGVPVRVDNDANVAALGEALNGAGRDHKLVFYVTLGSGVGGGIVIEGKIFHGAKPGESEIGHVRLDKSGTTVESRCSGWAVDKKLREAGLAYTNGGEAKLLNQLVAAGNEHARRILNETSDDLAFALSHVVHLFHPEIVVLGGGLSLLGEPLRAAV